jgi:hypothetical protein
MGFVIALDLSTKPGIACFQDGALKRCDTIFPKKCLNDFGKYPINFMHYADYVAEEVVHQVGMYRFNHDDLVVVIEETCAGRNNYSQKILEFIHHNVIYGLNIKEIPMIYIRTGVWRKAVGANLTKEEKAFNRKIAEIKRKTKQKLAKIDGKVVGKFTRKHAALRCFKDHFGETKQLKDNDAVEAALLGLAYLKDVPVCDGTIRGGTNVYLE